VESRRRWLVFLGAVVLVVGAGLAIGKAASYSKLLHDLRGAEVWWLGLCLLGEACAYAGYVVIYRETARVDGGPRFSVPDALRIVAAGFGALVLTTGAATLAVDYWALRRAGAKNALARVIALNTLEWAVLTAATFAAAVVLLGDVPLAAALPWLIVVPVCFAAALWVTAPARVGRLAGLGGTPARRLFAACVQGVQLVRRLPLRSFAGAGLYWAGDLLCLWGGLRAFGVHAGLASLVLAYSIGYLVAALPLPAGGAGGVDAAMTYALTIVGIPLAPALLGTFAYRLFNFWLPMLPALAVLPTVRRLGRPVPAT
jgi:glycosyltransferase 2 family protein